MGYLWQHYYGEHNSVGFRNEIISFLIPFLTHVLVQPTTFEFSLKVTLFVCSVVCLFLFDSYIANEWIGMTSASSLGHSAIYEVSTFQNQGQSTELLTRQMKCSTFKCLSDFLADIGCFVPV